MYLEIIELEKKNKMENRDMLEIIKNDIKQKITNLCKKESEIKKFLSKFFIADIVGKDTGDSIIVIRDKFPFIEDKNYLTCSDILSEVSKQLKIYENILLRMSKYNGIGSYELNKNDIYDEYLFTHFDEYSGEYHVGLKYIFFKYF